MQAELRRREAEAKAREDLDQAQAALELERAREREQAAKLPPLRMFSACWSGHDLRQLEDLWQSYKATRASVEAEAKKAAEPIGPLPATLQEVLESTAIEPAPAAHQAPPWVRFLAHHREAFKGALVRFGDGEQSMVGLFSLLRGSKAR
jgi:hypothetical protein